MDFYIVVRGEDRAQILGRLLNVAHEISEMNESNFNETYNWRDGVVDCEVREESGVVPSLCHYPHGDPLSKWETEPIRLIPWEEL